MPEHGEENKSLQLRDLEEGDYGKGYLELLSQLTTVGEVSQAEFVGQLQQMKAMDQGQGYKIMVIEDLETGKIVGTATAAIERKFIHQCGKVGHIEDVVVNELYRGKRLGHRLIEALVAACRVMGCYKVILDCSESNAPFYEKCGLVRKEIQMVKYLDR